MNKIERNINRVEVLSGLLRDCIKELPDSPQKTRMSGSCSRIRIHLKSLEIAQQIAQHIKANNEDNN